MAAGVVRALKEDRRRPEIAGAILGTGRRDQKLPPGLLRLTPEHIRRIKNPVEEAPNGAANTMAKPDERFEITLESLQALRLGGKAVRWRGYLMVVDGDRA